jgi:hypothetical protein
MAESDHIRELRAVWGQACHTMWTELTALRVTAAFVQENYRTIGDKVPLTDLVYAPESRGRMDDVTKSAFLGRQDTYLKSVVTGRIVLLSAAFELYFRFFLDAYIEARPKYFDSGTGARTTAGNKLYGDVTKVRGLAERITQFCELTDAGNAGIKPLLPALNDVYHLRNAIAHRAGDVDAGTAAKLSIVTISVGGRVAVTIEQLLTLADKVLELAAKLDSKIAGVSRPPPQPKKVTARAPDTESIGRKATAVFRDKGVEAFADWLAKQTSDSLRVIAESERLVALRRVKGLSDVELRRAIADGMQKRSSTKRTEKSKSR